MKDDVLLRQRIEDLKAAHEKERLALQRQILALQDVVKALGKSLPQESPVLVPTPATANMAVRKPATKAPRGKKG